jgi:hypothetical protein
MLTELSKRDWAAVWIRRPFPVCALALTVLVVLVACAGREKPERWDGARGAISRAIVELNLTDPLAAGKIEAALAEAEKRTALAAAAPPWRRHPDVVERAWLVAAGAAGNAVFEHRRLRENRERELSDLLRLADLEVATAMRQLSQPGLCRADARAVSLARLHLEAAHRFAAARLLEEGLVSAQNARDLAEKADLAFAGTLERFSDPRLLARWRQQVEDAVTASRRKGGSAIVVDKLRRQLILYRHGHLEAVFTAELGTNGLAPKLHAGDRATPEGQYRVVAKKSGDETRYHLAVLLDYPNREDRRRHERALRRGEIPEHAPIGSLIEIHGGGGSGRDWTNGCIALTNEDMDKLFPLVDISTPVTIVGTQ